MSDSLAAVVLAAGSGSRLRPLSSLLPKALCPVNNRALLDHALDRIVDVTESVAVNVHADPAAMLSHLEEHHPSVHASLEPGVERGTAGAIGLLRPWLDGRDVVILNGDTWAPGSVSPLLEGWDRERIRIFVHGGEEFDPRMRVAGSVMPWSDANRLSEEPTGLYEVAWRQAHAEGRVDVVRHDGPLIDCGTPADYLRANMEASGGQSVVGEGAVVEGQIEQSVLWPGANVTSEERLHRAIRADDRVTVLIR